MTTILTLGALTAEFRFNAVQLISQAGDHYMDGPRAALLAPLRHRDLALAVLYVEFVKLERSAMFKKQPPFKSEAQEAEWWAKNQDLIADRFAQAKAAGRLGKGTVARVAGERANLAGASPTITIRLAEHDLAQARAFAAEQGLRYQTYLKMLLHQALNTEENRPGGR